jgi:hypothetical protein
MARSTVLYRPSGQAFRCMTQVFKRDTVHQPGRRPGLRDQVFIQQFTKRFFYIVSTCINGWESLLRAVARLKIEFTALAK